MAGPVPAIPATAIPAVSSAILTAPAGSNNSGCCCQLRLLLSGPIAARMGHIDLDTDRLAGGEHRERGRRQYTRPVGPAEAAAVFVCLEPRLQRRAFRIDFQLQSLLAQHDPLHRHAEPALVTVQAQFRRDGTTRGD